MTGKHLISFGDSSSNSEGKGINFYPNCWLLYLCFFACLVIEEAWSPETINGVIVLGYKTTRQQTTTFSCYSSDYKSIFDDYDFNIAIK